MMKLTIVSIEKALAKGLTKAESTIKRKMNEFYDTEH